MQLSVAVFNAHWGVGRFGRLRGVGFDAARVIRSFDADVVVVPEAWRHDGGDRILDPLAGDGYHLEHVEFMRLAVRHDRSGERDAAPREGVWELTVCSRFPVCERRQLAMATVPGDPVGTRPALVLTLDVGGVPLELVAVHTSSRFWTLAPLRQLRSVTAQLAGDGRPQILAGDLNFWGPPVGAMMRGWSRPVRGRTYPAHRPHSQIDHVLVRGPIEGVGGEVLGATPSDHRPVVARLRLR
jgi:endonuclease/exonuclease/phosphatase family metal-dependent hydrolase